MNPQLHQPLQKWRVRSLIEYKYASTIIDRKNQKRFMDMPKFPSFNEIQSQTDTPLTSIRKKQEASAVRRRNKKRAKEKAKEEEKQTKEAENRRIESEREEAISHFESHHSPEHESIKIQMESTVDELKTILKDSIRTFIRYDSICVDHKYVYLRNISSVYSPQILWNQSFLVLDLYTFYQREEIREVPAFWGYKDVLVTCPEDNYHTLYLLISFQPFAENSQNFKNVPCKIQHASIGIRDSESYYFTTRRENQGYYNNLDRLLHASPLEITSEAYSFQPYIYHKYSSCSCFRTNKPSFNIFPEGVQHAREDLIYNLGVIIKKYLKCSVSFETHGHDTQNSQHIVSSANWANKDSPYYMLYAARPKVKDLARFLFISSKETYWAKQEHFHAYKKKHPEEEYYQDQKLSDDYRNRRKIKNNQKPSVIEDIKKGSLYDVIHWAESEQVLICTETSSNLKKLYEIQEFSKREAIEARRYASHTPVEFY